MMIKLLTIMLHIHSFMGSLGCLKYKSGVFAFGSAIADMSGISSALQWLRKCTPYKICDRMWSTSLLSLNPYRLRM